MSDEKTLESNEPSIEDTIAEKWAEIQERGGIDDEAESPSAQRDEKGRFAAKQETLEDDAPLPEEKPARKAPSSWKKEAQEKYGTLDALLQDEIDRRESDFHKGLENYKTKAQQAEEWEKTIQPFMRTIEGFGVPPQQAIRNLLAADHALRFGTAEQKQQLFYRLAQDYGIQFGQQQQEEIDPKLQPFVQKVQTLEQRLQAQEMERQRQHVLAEQQQQQQLNSHIAEFAKGKEHFETVRDDMAALLQAGRATDLEDAYQKAIWTNPEVRQALLAKQQEDAKAEALKKANEAKKAAQINVKKKGTFDQVKPIGTMEDTIREKARELGIM